VNRRALALLSGVGAAAPACGPITSEVDIVVLLPDDTSDLQRTNNASLTVEPDGIVQTYATDGLDFALSLSMTPDQDEHALALYLAEDERLLAWGATPPFTLLGAAPGLAILVGRPGGLSALSTEFDAPDAATLAAPIADRGVTLVDSEGITTVVDAHAYGVTAAGTLDDAPDPTDGVLVDDPAGGVQRIAAADGLRAARLDAGTGEWTERDLGTHGIEPRPGAAWVHDAARDRVWIVGGGAALDCVRVDLEPATAEPVAVEPGWTLDAVRPGAHAATSRDPARVTTFVFGSDDPARAVGWWIDGQLAFGPMTQWVDAGCVELDAGTRWACGGGVRDATPTADVLEVTLAAGAATVVEHVALLGAPAADPRWLGDEFAVYAQGDGRMWRLDRVDLAVREVAAASPRATGGVLTRLPTGFSLLVGGRDADGTALERWYVFAPDPVGDDG
jgi:hypothetical protein